MAVLRPMPALVFVFALGLPPAQAVEHIIDFWDAGRGLPGNAATAIAQTREGYLWIGTYEGLSRFDGIRFATFDPSNTPAFKHPRIGQLFTDAAGTLWINTYDGSLISWRNGSFTQEWTAEERVETGIWLASSSDREQVFVLQSGAVLRRTVDSGRAGRWETIRPPGTTFSPIFCATRSGELWIRSRDERLWRVVGGRLQQIPTSPGLVGRIIRCLTTDRRDRVYVGTDLEIGVWTGAGFERVTPENGEPRVDVSFLYFTEDGAFWAFANNRLRKGREGRWILEVEAPRHLADDVPRALLPIEDRRGGIWFAHGGRGLLHVDSDGTAHRFGPAQGFASERVMSLFQDREDNLWVSVDRGGLARVRERRFQVLNVPSPTAGYATLSVTEDRHGSIWIGTAGAGLARWREGVLTSFPLPPRVTRPFVLSIVPDGDRLWMSADLEDLWVFDGGVARPAPWPVHGIKVLLLDRARRLWIGRRDGLARWSLGRVEHFGPADGIGVAEVRSLAEDAQGSIWIGGGDGSIHRHRDGRFERISLDGTGPAYPIWSLLAERDGAVWAGRYKGGLLRLKDGGVTKYTARDGLSSDVVCQIVDDGLGHLWIGSREGILRVSKRDLDAFAEGRLLTLSSSTYGRADGIPPLECSGFQPGSLRARSGRLWFATTRGAVSVSPAELDDNRVPPPVVIEEVWVDRVRLQAPTGVDGPPGEVNGEGDAVSVPAGKREVEFRYTGLSLAAPEAVRFRYRLIGLEPDWVEAGERRSAHYSYLPPGDYRFQVIARNSDGVWSAQGASVSLKVLPHFWETWWFRALLIASSLAVAAAVARHLSTRALHRNLARLEQQRAIEHDRTRIAQDIHDDLGAGLTQISLLSELLRGDPPQEAQLHVEQIAETAAELTRAMDEIVWAVNPTDDTLDSLWSYLTHFAQEYLATAGIACRLAAPEALPGLPLQAEIRHNVFLAVKEALNNVVKHAAAGEVRLSLMVAGRQFEIEIQDDGCGRRASPASASLRVSSGQGMRNIEERMCSIGARYEVFDPPSGGTCVRLTVGVP